MPSCLVIQAPSMKGPSPVTVETVFERKERSRGSWLSPICSQPCSSGRPVIRATGGCVGVIVVLSSSTPYIGVRFEQAQ